MTDEQARRASERGLPGDDPAWWDWSDLKRYLEARGFAVYEHEQATDLLRVVLLDLEVE